MASSRLAVNHRVAGHPEALHRGDLLPVAHGAAAVATTTGTGESHPAVTVVAGAADLTAAHLDPTARFLTLTA
jgi:hypothetical protein